MLWDDSTASKPESNPGTSVEDASRNIVGQRGFYGSSRVVKKHCLTLMHGMTYIANDKHAQEIQNGIL